MKRVTGLFLFVVLLFSCQEECVQPFGPVAPEGYSINKIATVNPTASNLSNFQMVDATNGFALNDFNLYKTTDGGASWSSTLIPFSFTLESMLFTDENTGYITHRGNNNGAFVLKTTDGGENWENIPVDGFSYFFNDLQVDNAGNLYARSGIYGTASLVKSTDGGFTWTEIYSGNTFAITLLTVQENRIYFKESGNRLVILDLNGELVKSLSIRGNTQLKVLDEDNIIVLDQYIAHKTTDGGETWTVLYNDEAYVVDFSLNDGLLMLLNKDYCGDDPNELSAFARGTITNSSLVEADAMKDFEVTFLYATEKLGDGHFLLQHFGDIYELKKL